MTSEQRTAIASRLRLARERAGLSQGQVAKLVDMHRPSVSEIEAGRRSVTAEELTKFASIYSVTVGWLTGEPRDPAADRLELAARELSKLKPGDVDLLMDLLTSLRSKPEGECSNEKYDSVTIGAAQLGLGSRQLVEEETNGANPAALGDDEIMDSSLS